MTKLALPKDDVDSLAGNMLDAVQSFNKTSMASNAHKRIRTRW
jgi:hypothetical protein